jgi:hypothetical protein
MEILCNSRYLFLFTFVIYMTSVIVRNVLLNFSSILIRHIFLDIF